MEASHEVNGGSVDEEYVPQYPSPRKHPSRAAGEVGFVEYIPQQQQQVSRRSGGGGSNWGSFSLSPGSPISSVASPSPSPDRKKALAVLPYGQDQHRERKSAESEQMKASITFLNRWNMLVEPSSPPLHLVKDTFSYAGDFLEIYIFAYSSKRSRGRQCSGSGSCSTSSSSTSSSSTSFSQLATYGVCFREGNQLNCSERVIGSDEQQTAIRAELLAAQRALCIAKHKIGHRVVNLNTVSTFLLDNVMDWKKRIEKSESGRGGLLRPQSWLEVKHLEDIQQLCDSWSNMKVQFTLIEEAETKQPVVEMELAKMLAFQAHTSLD